MTLELRNITKSFGSVSVLADISLKFDPGTVTAIVGDNGAGKSTLLKAISGIHAVDGGDIYLSGVSITNASVTHRRAGGIEMIYQDLALARQRSILSNIFLGREIAMPFFGLLKRRAMRDRAQQHLAHLGIDLGNLDRPAKALSGGQQQAIAFARATMFDPKILLLDEPTAALAVAQVDRVLQSIRDEKTKGRILIMVSHRFSDIFAVADRIIVMKHGSIVSDLATANTTISDTVNRIVNDTVA